MADKSLRSDVLSLNEISAFCSQIAMILKSGIPMSEGVSILYDDMKNAQGKAIMGQLHDQVDRGAPLHQALSLSGVFPKYVVDMTEIGETTGRLEEVMDALSRYYQREEAIAKSIRSAVTYPLIMVGMMVVVIAVLVIKVLPIFNDVFRQLGGEMSGFSQAVMNAGTVIGRYSFIFIDVIAVLVVLYWIMRMTKGGRKLLARMSENFFATKKIKNKIASGRFASAMALMMASGMDTDQSLEMVARLIDNKLLRERIARCQKLLESGSNLSDALVQADIFSGVYARMVSVGFKTGSVDTVMQRLADQYEEEVDADFARMISVLEPTLVAILSIVVGMILLSVMLPLMGIMASIG